MSVELRPLSVQCNLRCDYCYQNPQRDAGGGRRDYDIAAMKAAIEREGGPFTLFGGEPLLVPAGDLEVLWAWGLERFGRNGIQTNGTLITDRHIELFRRYAVQVGISVDGPEELNDVRWHGTLERTRAATRKTHDAIARLCEEGMPPSLIITLHRGNACADRLPRLVAWLRALDGTGVRHVRLHLLESEDDATRERWGLTSDENVAALLTLAELEPSLAEIRFDLFREIEALLAGDDASVSCVWRACDPYTTAAVRGVEGSGRTSNCGRTNKEGVDFLRPDLAGYERPLTLFATPFEDGGCAGCRFFVFCKGQCPGTAVEGDWRNRTEHCAAWTALLERAEQALAARGITPLSLSERRSLLEERLLDGWRSGVNRSFAEALA